MTPKQALSKWNADNPSKAIAFSEGRGRLSRDAVAKCTELAGKGWRIDGYVISESAKTEPTVTKVAKVNEKVVQDFVIFYEETAFKALDNSGGMWSMREVCNKCRVSLVQCHCGAPTILGGIAIRIVSK